MVLVKSKRINNADGSTIKIVSIRGGWTLFEDCCSSQSRRKVAAACAELFRHQILGLGGLTGSIRVKQFAGKGTRDFRLSLVYAPSKEKLPVAVGTALGTIVSDRGMVQVNFGTIHYPNGEALADNASSGCIRYSKEFTVDSF